MSDLITRQDAIDTIEHAIYSDDFRSSTGVIHKAVVYDVIRNYVPDAHVDKRIAELLKSNVHRMTDDDGLVHHVIHYGDLADVIYEVFGWTI